MASNLIYIFSLIYTFMYVVAHLTFIIVPWIAFGLACFYALSLLGCYFERRDQRNTQRNKRQRYESNLARLKARPTH